MWMLLLSALFPHPATPQSAVVVPAVPEVAHRLQLEVVDPAGHSIPDACATWRARDGILMELTWTPVESAAADASDSPRTITLESDSEEAARSLVLVRAHGYETQILEHDAQEGETRRVTLQPAQPITLYMASEDGRSIPDDLVPAIVTERFRVDAWLGVQDEPSLEDDTFALDMFPTRWLAEGEYEVDLPAEVEFWILINEPGFLRAYQAGPFRRSELEGDVLELTLPAPATLEVTFGPGKETPAPYARCGIQLGHVVDDLGYFFILALHDQEGPRASGRWEDLAPQVYSIEAFTGGHRERHERNPERFSVQDQRELEPHGSASVTLAYEPFPAADLVGEHSVTLTVLRQDGSPASDAPYALTYYPRNYPQREVRSGVLSAEGSVELSGLPGGERALPLQLMVDGRRLGAVDLSGDSTPHQLEFRLAPGAGDPAPGLDLIELAGEAPRTLADYAGQVLFLDVWATWCGPCQKPMAHSNEIMARRAEDWAGRAAILGISIDDAFEDLQGHIESTGWDSVPQLWSGPDSVGWASQAAQSYGVTGVPTAFLIDAEGTIVWRGHPASFDVEANIDRLLAGD